MAHCPFCNGEVDEQIVIYGGTCPHCFGDVPGEETPTDPGEAVKAEMVAADRAQAQRRTMLPIYGLAALVCAALGGSALYVVASGPPAEEIVLDDAFLDGLDLEFAEFTEPEEEPEAVAAAPKAQRAKRGGTLEQRLSTGGGLVGSSGSATEAMQGAAASASDGTRYRKKPTVTLDRGAPSAGMALKEVGSAGDGSVGLDLQLNTRRTAALLESEDDIRNAIRQLWRDRGGQLKQCHDRRLKDDDTIAGEWKVAFTIGVDGKVSEASAVGQQMNDAKLEACIKQKVSGWSIYGRLAKPRSLKLPITFRN